MLSAASIFPTQQFLRYGNEPQVNNNCGGVASLIVIGVLLAIFIAKMISTSRRQTVYLTQQNNYGFRPQMAGLTTNFAEPGNAPFMVAAKTSNFASFSGELQLDVKVVYQYNSKKNNETISDSFPMVPCTEEHFVMFETMRKQIGTIFQNITSLQCLPLNQKYLIGGNLDAQEYGTLTVIVTPGNATGQFGGDIFLYESNSILNPVSQNQTIGRSFNSRYQRLLPKKLYQYQNKLKKQTLQSDQSLTPFSDIKQYISTLLTLNLYNIVNQQQYGSDFFMMKGEYLVSSESILYKRHYFKYTDVISYVGGFFSPIIALFFFMRYIGEFHFEMSFGKKQFRNKEGKHRGFWSYMKYTIFKIATAVGLQPSWQTQRKQMEMRDVANRLLNVNYIIQRINFLQRAITILFDRHHLKGLYLIHNASILEAKTTYKNYQYRDQIVKYLYDKRVKGTQDANKDNKSNNMSSGLCYSHDRLQKDDFKNDNLDLELPENFPQIKLMTYATQKESQKDDSLKHKLKEPQYLAQISQEMEMLRDEDFEETIDEEAMKELQRDFRRLMEEAENRQCDERSRRIYDSLDEYLKGLMQLEFEEDQQRMLMASLERAKDQ